jgi:hypothetical protein
VELTAQESVFGRVLLDVDDQCIKSKRILTSSPLSFHRGGQLVEVVRDREGHDTIISGVFVWAVTEAAVAHKTVDPTKLDFPWTLMLVGPRPHFVWGELEMQVEITVAEFREMEVSPSQSPANMLGALALGRLGRFDEINRKETHPDLAIPARRDLRYSNYRPRIEALIGKRILGSYYETAYAYGYDLGRFYDPVVDTEEVLLCPYCRSVFDPSSSTCSACGEATGRDAPFETSVHQLAISERKPCKACKAPLLRSAVLCRWCHTRQ